MSTDFEPLARPLKSLKEVESWVPEASLNDAFNVASVKLQIDNSKELQEPVSVPKLLVCHDMGGGYKDDSHIQGGKNADAFRLWDWRVMHSFVYFSHDLVTIPPPCWTNAAHLHGTKVLGTFITEGPEGYDKCKEILKTVESAHFYAKQLAAIAKFYGFDGWLLNIENKVDAPAQVENLIEFSRHLTTQMHDMVPGSEVIWYDAVTSEGTLWWQNSLTEHNQSFFKVTDGIFTNYQWGPRQLAASAAMARERKLDVYMGVDVFARGTEYKEGFESIAAVKQAFGAGVSSALFAPGWVYEKPQTTSFEVANTRFWDIVAESSPPTLPRPSSLPFFTSFDQGVGRMVCRAGQVVSPGPWNNISLQKLQPLHHSQTETSTAGSGVTAGISYEKAYDGGCCMDFVGTLSSNDSLTFDLYEPLISIPGDQQRLIVEYSVVLATGCDISVVLALRGADGVVTKQIIRDGGSQSVEIEPQAWQQRRSEFPVPASADIVGISAVCTPSSARDPNGSKEESDDGAAVNAPLRPYRASLGHIMVATSEFVGGLVGDSGVKKIQWSDAVWAKAADGSGEPVVSLTLFWDEFLGGGNNSGNGEGSEVLSNGLGAIAYDVYVSFTSGEVSSDGKDRVRIGTAVLNRFRVYQLRVPEGCQRLHFWVPAQTRFGIWVSDEVGVQVDVPKEAS